MGAQQHTNSTQAKRAGRESNWFLVSIGFIPRCADHFRRQGNSTFPSCTIPRVSISARSLALLLTSCFLLSATRAQQLDSKLYQGLRWRLVGPFRGGRTVSVAGIAGNPNVYYFGAVGGGVWKTTNGGITWNPLFDSQSVASIGAIALAPSDANTIYV